MPELRVAGRTLATDDGDNLLDALLDAGLNVPYSCRAGACHACMVRCRGELEDAQPQALSPAQREQGWRLACQCRLRGDLDVELFDPQREGLPARIACQACLAEALSDDPQTVAALMDLVDVHLG